MTQLTQFSQAQYEFVKDSREALFEYCKTISPNHFVDQNTSFGRGGSMRNLMVHIGNTYQYWIGNLSLTKSISYTPYEAIVNVQQVVALFDSVDKLMDEFMSNMDSKKEIEFEIKGVKHLANPLKLFSHVITHEYHHKGQILSLSRHLGYIPADTDIMR